MNASFLNNWTNQIRKGLLELSILNDIRNRKMYGYEIERKFRKSQGLLISDGTIYHILRRLRQQRLVKTRTKKSPDGARPTAFDAPKSGGPTYCPMINEIGLVQISLNH